MNNYPYHQLWINGRRVFITDILEEKVIPQSLFEQSTFHFIRDWLNDSSQFTLQTSGSTGKPKKITITREQMIASAKLTEQALGLSSNFNALVCLDTNYIAGKMMLVRSFVTGMYIYAIDPTANPLCKIPVDVTVHFAAFVPYQITSILGSKRPHLLDSLMTCIIGGAPLSETAREKLQFFSTKIFATYGMTETISHVALQPVNGPDRSECFFTQPGVTVKKDDRGCLVLNVPFLHEELTTNDLVEVLNDNAFKWLGRWDNVINSGGIKVSPENLEERIGKLFTRLEINNPYFVHGLPDEKLGQRVVLVLEAPLPSQIKLNQLKQELIHSFTAYELPKEIFFSSAFIHTETAKINRHESIKHVKPISSFVH